MKRLIHSQIWYSVHTYLIEPSLRKNHLRLLSLSSSSSVYNLANDPIVFGVPSLNSYIYIRGNGTRILAHPLQSLTMFFSTYRINLNHENASIPPTEKKRENSGTRGKRKIDDWRFILGAVKHASSFVSITRTRHNFIRSVVFTRVLVRIT